MKSGNLLKRSGKIICAQKILFRNSFQRNKIFEYTTDALLGGDAQRVSEALRLGTSPIADTMTDVIITAVGIAVFYIGLYIDKRCGYPVSKHLE